MNISVTVSVELPNKLSPEEFADSFPYNIHDHDVRITNTKLLTKELVDRDLDAPLPFG